MQYNPIETRPETLLQRIASERRQNGPAAQATSGRAELAGGGAARTDNPATLNIGASAAFGPAKASGNLSVSVDLNKDQAKALIQAARAALAISDLVRAEQLARQADKLAAESAFSGQEDRPSLVLLDIQRARVRNSGVVTASAEMPINSSPAQHRASQSLYDSNNDPTRVIAAGSEEPVVRPLPIPDSNGGDAPNDNAPPAVQMLRQGEKALADGNRDEALRLFRQAYASPDQLDPATRQRLQDHLQMMASGVPLRPGSSDGLLDAAAAHQQVLIRQVSADVSRLQDTAQDAGQGAEEGPRGSAKGPHNGRNDRRA